MPETLNQPSARKSPLEFLRRNLLAIDVCVIGFLGMLIGWTLLSLVAPGLRLYPYDARFAWAEMPVAGLLGQLSAFLVCYMLFQRIGMRYHREHVIGGAKVPRWVSVGHLIHVFSPMLMLPMVFNMLGAFIAGVSGVPTPVDHAHFDPGQLYDPAASWWDLELKRIDIAMTGVYLPEWFRAYHGPAISGFLMLAYLSYYLSPFVTIWGPVRRRDWVQLRHVGAVFVGTLLLTYLGYIAIPSTGPRFEGTFAAWMITEPGWFGAQWWQGVLDEAELIRWDAFPSGHTAISVIALLIAARHAPRVAWVYLPLTLGLIVATVFFGYHYVTDVIAGFAFAAVGMIVLRPMMIWWDAPHGLQVKPGSEA